MTSYYYCRLFLWGNKDLSNFSKSILKGTGCTGGTNYIRLKKRNSVVNFNKLN